MKTHLLLCCVLIITMFCGGCSSLPGKDPLPSWNDGANKQAIIDFVERVTDRNGPDYVPPAERVATFDNDGCLWAEQPVYFQLIFAMDRIKAMAGDHPEWKDTEPFKHVLADDIDALAEGGKEGLFEVLYAAHGGMPADTFREQATAWQASAKHPRFDRLYTSLTYQPQLELLAYLRDNGFKTYIVSGGGIDFLRLISEDAYGIPPEQVIGSSLEASYEVRDGKPMIIKQPKIAFIDDKEGKPVGIYQHIGRRPVIAVGNSDGDFAMLEYTTSGEGPRLGIYVHHDDAQREWAYDRDSHVGKLDRGLDEAPKRGWLVVSMKNDWNKIFK